jgi:hypothetical protein
VAVSSVPFSILPTAAKVSAPCDVVYMRRALHRRKCAGYLTNILSKMSMIQ